MRGMVSKTASSSAAAAGNQNNNNINSSGGTEPIVRKGPWMPEEDEVLLEYVRQYGPRDWSSIRSKGLLPRTGKSCRLRWVNKLKPDLKSGCKFSPEEERMVVKMQAKLGNKWAKIASYLPGRTDNDVKNFWSTRQKRILRALQRPKLASGSGDTAATSTDGSSPSYVSKNANELTAFQVPSPFYFGDEEQQSFQSREIKVEAADLHGFEQHIAPEDTLFQSSGPSFMTEHHHGFHHHASKPAAAALAAAAAARRSSKSRRERHPLEQQPQQEITSGGDQMLAHNHHHPQHHHHPPVAWRANECVFGVNFFADGAELDFLLHPEAIPSSSCMQQGIHDFPHAAHQWEKLPVLYTDSEECSATSFPPEAAASAAAGCSADDGANVKCSKAMVDSCSPDSVLANLPGDVFDCLEPLCPGPAEWWVSRAG